MTIKATPTPSRSTPGSLHAPGLAPRSEPPAETAGLARAAGVISLGNIASRILGLVRETVKADFFGAGGAVDAFNVAAVVPTMLYDLLVGGMVSSALVPVFSEYDAQERREALWSLVSVLLSIVAVVLAVTIILLELFAPQVAFLLSSGSKPEVLALTARLLRITGPALLFLSLSGVLSGLLYALKRFSYPAMTAAAFNAAIVAVTLILGRRVGIAAMAFGLLLGATVQVALQLPGLRDARLRFRLNWKHPGLRRIGALYVPIVLGLLLDVLFSRPISYNLASRTGEGGISWMNYATTLIQFPHGLVATAVSIAILPTLSAHAAMENREGADRFRATLAQGLRLVIVLIIPASVGLLVLTTPTIALLFEHGDFGVADTGMTAWALRLYLIGLPFAAVDLLLVFAFYARQDTLTPALIGAYSIAVYLAVAVLLLPHLGLFSLMVADSVKHILHTGVSALILRRRLGRLAEHRVGRTLALTTVASAAMGLAAFGVLRLVRVALPGSRAVAEVMAVVGPGIVGAALYVGLVTAFGIDEVRLMWGVIRRRMAG
jgi:putative peptidoglycan lipid II flippase